MASEVVKPGSLLRQARRQQQISLADLAASTHLQAERLAAMEEDHFDRLGQAVYARGYYRKVAVALGLDPAKVLNAFEAATGTESPVPPVQQRPSIDYREGPGLALWLGLGAVFLASIGGVLWWLFRSGQLAL